MKNKFSVLLFALFAFAACKQPVSQLALYVPKDASAVFIIDSKAIADKTASSGITLDSLANLFTKHKDENALRWDDIKNSGIELNKPVYIFLKEINSIQQGSIKSGGLIAEVEDEKKLEAFLKKKKPGSNIVTGEKYKYITLHNDVVAGWTDKILIISSVKSTDSARKDNLSQLQLTTLFAQKESASIASLDAFSDMPAKPADIYFYTNTAAKLDEVAMPGMSKINTLLQDSYTEGTINFEKGKIDATGETHYNKTLSDILDKYPSKDINKDMLKNYPGMLTGFGIISFNPKLLVEILHYLGFDIMADSFTSSLGFTTNDVINAFSGDIAVMFSSRQDSIKQDDGFKDGGFLLNAGIGDKAAFDKVMAGLLNKEILSKKGDEYQLGMAGGHGFVIETGSNSLFIGSSDKLIKAYQASGNKAALPADAEKEMNNKSMLVYFDINNFLQNNAVKDSSVDVDVRGSYYTYTVSKAAKETFKNFMASADKGDGKTIASSYRLNFVNDNENSLASLAKFMAVAHKESIKQKAGSKLNVQDFPVADSMPAEDSGNE